MQQTPGHPAITLPIETADGLACGTMLVGPHGSEEAMLAVAATIEKSLGLQTPTVDRRSRGGH